MPAPIHRVRALSFVLLAFAGCGGSSTAGPPAARPEVEPARGEASSATLGQYVDGLVFIDDRLLVGQYDHLVGREHVFDPRTGTRLGAVGVSAHARDAYRAQNDWAFVDRRGRAIEWMDLSTGQPTRTLALSESSDLSAAFERIGGARIVIAYGHAPPNASRATRRSGDVLVVDLERGAIDLATHPPFCEREME